MEHHVIQWDVSPSCMRSPHSAVKTTETVLSNQAVHHPQCLFVQGVFSTSGTDLMKPLVALVAPAGCNFKQKPPHICRNKGELNTKDNAVPQNWKPCAHHRQLYLMPWCIRRILDKGRRHCILHHATVLHSFHDALVSITEGAVVRCSPCAGDTFVFSG